MGGRVLKVRHAQVLPLHNYWHEGKVVEMIFCGLIASCTVEAAITEGVNDVTTAVSIRVEAGTKRADVF